MVNVLLSLAKKRKINGHDDSSNKTKNGKIKVHYSLCKRQRNFYYDLGSNLGRWSNTNLLNE